MPLPLAAIMGGVGAVSNLMQAYNAFTTGRGQKKEAAGINVEDVRYQADNRFTDIAAENRNQMFGTSQAQLNMQDAAQANMANSMTAFNNVQGGNPAAAAAMAGAANLQANKSMMEVNSFGEQLARQRKNDYLNAVVADNSEKKFAYNQNLARSMRMQDRKDRLEAAGFQNINSAIGKVGSTAMMLGAGAATAPDGATFGQQMNAAFSNYGGATGGMGMGGSMNPYMLNQLMMQQYAYQQNKQQEGQ
jgi:hypothetical protein